MDIPSETEDEVIPAETTHLRHYEDRLRHYVDQSQSDRTKREYASDWRQWEGWCEEEQVSPLPARPIGVACFCVAMADRGLALSTIKRRLVTIREAHRRCNHPDPTSVKKVEATLDGIRRDPEVNSSADNAKAALRTQHVRQIVELLAEEENEAKAARDKLIFLVGFCGGLRRSELATLQVDDLSIQTEGMLVRIQRSKTDQEGAGQEVSIHRADEPIHCPVEATAAWMGQANLDNDDHLIQSVDRWGNVGSGGVTGRTIANVVKSRAEEIGLDEREYSGHSLRAGFVTELKSRGEGDSEIMEQTRHVSSQTLRRYDRASERFRMNYTGALGL